MSNRPKKSQYEQKLKMPPKKTSPLQVTNTHIHLSDGKMDHRQETNQPETFSGHTEMFSSHVNAKAELNNEKQIQIAREFELPGYLTVAPLDQALDENVHLSQTFYTLDLISVFKTICDLTFKKESHLHTREWKFPTRSYFVGLCATSLGARLYRLGISTSQLRDTIRDLRELNLTLPVDIIQLIDEIGLFSKSNYGFKAAPLVNMNLIQSIFSFALRCLTAQDDSQLDQDIVELFSCDIAYGSQFAVARLLGQEIQLRGLTFMNPTTSNDHTEKLIRALDIFDSPHNRRFNWDQFQPMFGVGEDAIRAGLMLVSTPAFQPTDENLGAVIGPIGLQRNAPDLVLELLLRNSVFNSDATQYLGAKYVLRQSKMQDLGRYSVFCTALVDVGGFEVTSAERPDNSTDYTMAAVLGWNNLAVVLVEGGTVMYLNFSNKLRQIRAHRSNRVNVTRGDLILMYDMKSRRQHEKK